MKPFFISFFLALLFFTPQALAETTTACQPIYGGGETCQQSEQISINKKVLNSNLTYQRNQTYKDSDFVDHITPTNRPYRPNQQTAFRLFVTNTSNRDLTTIKVEDIFPPRYITFVTGSGGTYNQQTRTFSTTIASLKANETKSVTIQVMTARDNELPQQTLCTVNQARASVGREISEDNSQLCMNKTGETLPSPTPVKQATTKEVVPSPTLPQQSKGGLPIQPVPQTKKTPDTGAEHLLILAPLAGAGFLLRRKTK